MLSLHAPVRDTSIRRRHDSDDRGDVVIANGVGALDRSGHDRARGETDEETDLGESSGPFDRLLRSNHHPAIEQFRAVVIGESWDVPVVEVAQSSTISRTVARRPDLHLGSVLAKISSHAHHVPEVPRPATKWVISGTSARISVRCAVVRFGLAGLAYW